MKRSNRILALVMCALSLIALRVPVYGAGGDIGADSKLTVQLTCEAVPVTGARLEVYRIAGRSGEREFELTEEFSGASVDIACEDQTEWNACALALEAYAAEQKLAPVCAGETGEDGAFAAEGLAPGLYLVSGSRTGAGDLVYTSQAFIVALPEICDDGSISCEVSAAPKSIAAEKTERVRLHVIKVWDDKGKESLRPGHITVKLLRGGKVYGTAKLSKENSWSCTWEDLNAESSWLVSEEVPEGYTVKTERFGDTVRITNQVKAGKSAPEKPGPRKEKLPQTGQLWWPVPVLLCGGLMCVILGIAGRRRND